MIALIKDIELKMWEATPMPEAEIGTDGKMVRDQATGKVKNTGKSIEYTTYTFRDLLGETLKIMSRNNKFREFEGKTVNLVLNVIRKEFMGKTDTKINIKEVELAKK